MNTISTNVKSATVAGDITVQKAKEVQVEELKMSSITNLPDDILYHILSFLDVKSLCRICQVCRFFKYIASKDSVWLYRLNQLLVHIKYCDQKWQNAEKNETRSIITSQRYECNLARKSRYKAGINWMNGIFKESNQVSHSSRTKLMPWLQREESNLWLSTGKVIRCFRVQKNGNLKEWKGRQLYGLDDDVSRFVVKDGFTVSACSDGSICGWSNDNSQLLFHYVNLHESNVHCIDFYKHTVVSGSRDRTVKVVSTCMGEDEDDDKDNMNLLKKTIYMGDRVWSLKLSPDGCVLGVGTAGNRGLPALTTWDINIGDMLGTLETDDHQQGAGILDMKFENPVTLLTCGYDTNLRMWDLRTNTCVATWTEPFDSAVHCFQTDGNNYMVTGTARYGMTRLWDKRKNHSIQQYYSGRQHSSPVYSLTFDPGRLFVALDAGVNKLDFT